MIRPGRSYGDALTKNEVDGIQHAKTPLSLSNPATSQADVIPTIQAASSITIGDANDSITIAKTGLTYVRASPKWKNFFLKVTNPTTQSVVSQDAGGNIHAYVTSVGGSTSTEIFLSVQFIFPIDYISNSEIKVYLKWGACYSVDIPAGKTTTLLLGYCIYADNVSQMPALTTTDAVVVNSPHNSKQEYTTLLGAITPTASAGSNMMLVVKSTASDTSFNRAYYGYKIEYQSNE